MAKKHHPDERVVYLGLKNIFKGQKAEVRQLHAIQRLVTKHQNHAEVKDLIREHDIASVCSVARTLLTEQIFESTLKAKLRFPEVFDVSPTQSAEREASEAEAAKNESDAIRDAAQGHHDKNHSLKQSETEVESISSKPTHCITYT